MSKMEATYIDHMGSDLSVVNAARVSFSEKSEWDRKLSHWNHGPFGEALESEGYEFEQESTSGDIYCKLSKRDKGLIRFLARGCASGDWEDLVDTLLECEGSDFRSEVEEILQYVKNMPTHWTPFGHTAVTLHIKAPIFVARQLGKHQVGMVWNEVSRRYVDDEPELYAPKYWRKAVENVKQGSSDEPVRTSCVLDQHGEHTHPMFAADDVHTLALHTYNQMIQAGVAAEQARMVLPQSLMTEFYWTGNLYAFANVFIQRTDSHAQKEVQEVAHQIGDIIEPLFPVSWAALTAS